MNQDTAAVCVFLLLCCFMSTFETNNCGDTATIICDVLSCQCFVSVLLQNALPTFCFKQPTMLKWKTFDLHHVTLHFDFEIPDEELYVIADQEQVAYYNVTQLQI